MRRTQLLDILATRILAVQIPYPTRVAVDGVDAAGKTFLAGELAAYLPTLSARTVIRASIDRFHNPREVRYRQGPSSPDGYYEDSFNLPALRRGLLDPLGPGGGRAFQTGLFDHQSDKPVKTKTSLAAQDAILLFDGIFLQRPELAGCWDFIIFVQVSFDTVLKRAMLRDKAILGDEQTIISRYQQRYIPAQRRYLETCAPQLRANIVVGNDDPADPQLLSA